MHYRVVTTALIASIISLAPALARADAGHAHVGEPGKAGEVTRTIEVVMNDQMRFQPTSFSAKRGEVIRFVVKNVGEMPHEFVLGTPEEIEEHYELMQTDPDMEHHDPNTVSVEPGETGEMVWKFKSAGAFRYACLKPGHSEAGMVGNVFVRS